MRDFQKKTPTTPHSATVIIWEERFIDGASPVSAAVCLITDLEWVTPERSIAHYVCVVLPSA